MFHKVEQVYPLPNFVLDVRFTSQERRTYDVKPLFDLWPVFRSLRDIRGLFEQVQVDAGGYGVSWNDDIDLSCNELWENGSIY